MHGFSLLMILYVRSDFTWSLGVFVIGPLRLPNTYSLIAHELGWSRIIFGRLWVRELLLFWPMMLYLFIECDAPFLKVIFESFFLFFILWKVWKAHNAFKFNSQRFSVNAIIHGVGLDLGLTSSAFRFKPSQLWGVLDSQIAASLWVIAPPRRPIRLTTWMQPPHGIAKLTVDGCYRGNLGMAALGGKSLWSSGRGFDCFWIFSWLQVNIVCRAYGCLGGIGTRCSAWLVWAWGRVGFRHDGFLNSFPGSCSMGLCIFFASIVRFNIFLSYFGKACALEGYFCYWFSGQLGLYSSG